MLTITNDVNDWGQGGATLASLLANNDVDPSALVGDLSSPSDLGSRRVLGGSGLVTSGFAGPSLDIWLGPRSC